jgi:hypothetical protein
MFSALVDRRMEMSELVRLTAGAEEKPQGSFAAAD